MAEPDVPPATQQLLDDADAALNVLRAALSALREAVAAENQKNEENAT